MTTETNYAEQFYASISNESDILKKNTEGYPFSDVARFLLLYHSKKNNDPSFDQLAKQSAIYFNNVPWIQYQLAGINHEGIEVAKDTDIKEETDSETIENLQNIFSQQIETPSNIVNEEITQIPDQVIKYETETLGFSEEQRHCVPQEEPQETHYAANAHVNGSVGHEQITQVPDQVIKYETETLGFLEEERQIASQEETQETYYAANAALNEPVGQEEITQFPDQVIKYETETLGFSEERQMASHEEPHETEFAADEQKTGNSIQHAENEEELTLFEPLHTVDYFASQGIKISEEALENDQLGQQVKSFTAWLKSMKKLHPGQLPEQNEVIEKIIQSSSEVSNHNANVLTEAMAEVLMKQGKRAKAIEMYEKLSLMNPSKSAYFAAKIESLKTI